jgi:hypothetical protein
MSMYYHTDMRYVALIILAGLIISAAQEMAGKDPPLKPVFTLKDSVIRDWGIEPLAAWGELRELDGIGWKLGTVARGDGSLMRTSYTVVHPPKAEPFVLQHCYVLAAYDLVPSGILLVVVRDPEYYLAGYDYTDELTDMIEAVWYSDDWEEESAMQLDFAPQEHADGFVLAPDQRTLLAIRHPVDTEGEPAIAGHELVQVSLEAGWIRQRALPGYGDDGVAPAGWWPVRMRWDNAALLVQAGDELRRYSMEWQ